MRHRIGGYREFEPSAAAASFCEAFWTHRTPTGPSIPGAAHRVLPDPALSVAFRVQRDEEGRPVSGGLVLIGPKSRPQLFPLIPGLELAAVRLKVEWVAPMLDVDPFDLDGEIVPLAAVGLPGSALVEDRLWRTRSAAEALSILALAVQSFRRGRLAPAPAAAAALDLVRRSAGRVPCHRVARSLGVSLRHLRRQVRDAAGLSPKAYARAVRLARAVQIADRAPHPDWADIAIASGYCDQSHLIRDCVALAGESPGQLHNERARQRVAERSNPDRAS